MGQADLKGETVLPFEIDLGTRAGAARDGLIERDTSGAWVVRPFMAAMTVSAAPELPLSAWLDYA
jgi:hypothetical protein